MPLIVADQLGYDLTKDAKGKDTTVGVMGTKLEVYLLPMILQLIDPAQKKVLWASKKVLIRCVDHNNVPPLLGISDFLSNFSFTFNYKSVSKRNIILHV